MNSKDYVVGIDLGTSNITLSYGKLKTDEIETLDLAQLSSPGQYHEKSSLPAFLFLGHNESEKKTNAKLPWLTSQEESPSFSVGSFAQERHLEKPQETIASAKSWLCHKHIDPRTAHLPWGSSSTNKMSAFDVMCAFLGHLKQVFNWKMTEEHGKKIDLKDFDLVITVPASFDEEARRLVYDAAQKVGLKKASLLEEPQAALYSWIKVHEESWRDAITPGDMILVCDVGGGTSDFSLVCVGEEKGKLILERISVGKHLLLGGDNMDYTLAYHLKRKFEESGVKLDKWQYLSLVGQARRVKENFFEDEKLKEASLSVASKGSSLMASTKSLTVTREETQEILCEGFFPLCEKTDLPALTHQTALQDIGLEYETETAITKHLAAFLTKSASAIASSPKLSETLKSLERNISKDLEEGFIKPSALLFNGGVFKGTPLRERVLKTLEHWGCSSLKELPGYELDLAVSRGASYYGKTKKSGKGIRIQAGTARSYYLGVESTGIAIPGIPPSIKGLCVVPQGTEEGTKLPSPGKEFGLMTGGEFQFRFFSSDERGSDKIGEEIEEADSFLTELSPMKVKLDSKEGAPSLVPVSIDSYVNDVGILELSMHDKKAGKNWNLEFNVRKTEDA